MFEFLEVTRPGNLTQYIRPDTINRIEQVWDQPDSDLPLGTKSLVHLEGGYIVAVADEASDLYTVLMEIISPWLD